MDFIFRHVRQGLWMGFAACCLLSFQASFAASPDSSPAEPLVEQALQKEIQGDAAGRRESLLHAIFQDTDYAPARWQNGQLNYHGSWLDYQNVSQTESTRPEFQEYLKIRKNFAMRANEQLKLANWCRDQKLFAQEYAHLIVALELSGNPNNLQIRSRLGHQFLNGVWMTPTEIAEFRDWSGRIQSASKTWKPKLKLLARQIRSPDTDLRNQAREEILALNDPDLLPVLEATFSQDSLQSASLLVELLSQMKLVEANRYLARQAVLSPYVTVRDEAAKSLRSRPVETFAPLLLESMHTPIQSRVGLFVGRSGVRLTQVLFSESQDLRDVAGLDSRSLVVRQSQRGRRRRTPSLALGTRANRFGNNAIPDQIEDTNARRLISLALLDKQMQLYQRQRALDFKNDQISEWNEQVCETLRQATGKDLPDDPQKWWEWWEEFNQLHTPGEKPTRGFYAREIQVREVAELQPAAIPIRGSGGRRCECLVAGTPIWTDRGFVPIDKIQIGDRVLAQHPRTGRLAYQPVLRTTVRPATALMTARFGSSQVTSTEGHTFWVSGTGWQKIRDIPAGSPFHTVDGLVKLDSRQKAEPQRTYNLIVAGFHTYFVGRDMLLSRDVTFAQPVNNTVPGLRSEVENP